jgi:hypothetical protein
MFGWKKKAAEPPAFPPEDYEPVIRSSICTGEKVACMRERESGKLLELMLLRTPEDLEAFRRQYGVTGEIPNIY